MIGRGVFGRPEPEVSKDSSDSISAFALMAGFERSNNSQNFRGGDLTAVMGGCEIDLRQASLRAPAIIDIFVMWGGVEIRVPDDWTVDLQGTPMLAGFVDKTRPPALATEKRLVIRGTAQKRLAVVVERAHRLSTDELDRLALAEPAPIAFLATLRRFAPDAVRATLEAAGGRHRRTPRRRPQFPGGSRRHRRPPGRDRPG